MTIPSNWREAASRQPGEWPFFGITLPHRRPQLPAITIEHHMDGRLLHAVCEGTMVAQAKQQPKGPDERRPAFAITLADGSRISSAHDPAMVRQVLRWAGAYHLGRQARGLAPIPKHGIGWPRGGRGA